MRFRTRSLTANLARTTVVDCVQENTGCGDTTDGVQREPCEYESQPPCQEPSEPPPPPCEQESQAPEISGCSNTEPCPDRSKALHGGGTAMKHAIRAQMARAARTPAGTERGARG